MRRVFTHLTSGWQTGPFIHGEKRFSGRPGLSHFGREQNNNNNNKSFWPTQPGGRAVSFFLLLYYIYLIKIKYLIQFRSLCFLQTPASSARARCAAGQAPKKEKKDKKSNKSEENPENRKKVLVDPGRHFPVPYFMLLAS